MSERAMDEIKSNILEQIYNHNGGIELRVLFEILESSYGISEKTFNNIASQLVADNICIIERIVNLDKDETSGIFETAINREKDRVKKIPKIQNTIDYAIVMAIYEKSIKLIGKDNLVYEAKKMRRIVESIMPDRHSLLESFL